MLNLGSFDFNIQDFNTQFHLTAEVMTCQTMQLDKNVGGKHVQGIVNLGCREALEIVMNHFDTFQDLVTKHCTPVVSGRPTGKMVGMQGAASQKWERTYTYGSATPLHQESSTLWLTMV